MIYHDLERSVVLPRRGAVFTLEGLAMLAGALVGAFVEEHVTRLVASAVAVGLALPLLVVAERFAALRATRAWRLGLLAVALVCGALGFANGGATPVVLGIAASLLLGEAGAIAAIAAPWPRELAGWRPVCVVSVRLFGLVSAGASLPGSLFTGIAAGALGGVVVLLVALPLMFPAPAEVVFEGRRQPARREPCPRCGVPVDWPTAGPGTCTACGLIRRDVR